MPTWNILEKTETEKTSSYMYQHHRVFSIAYYVHCSYDYLFIGFVMIASRDSPKLEGLAHNIKTILSTNVPMVGFTRNEWEIFNSATHCYEYEKPLTSDDTGTRSLPFDRGVPRIKISI